MATIAKEGMLLKVGRDIVDALTGSPVTHGTVSTLKVTYRWQSTMSIVDAERAIRKAAKEDRVRIVGFVSQACAPSDPYAY